MLFKSKACKLLLGTGLAATAIANVTAEQPRRVTIEAHTVTGPNDRCGVQQWRLPEPFLDLHFTVVGSFNDEPNALNANPLTEESCADPELILASYSNPLLNQLGGIAEGDVRLNNIPFRKVAVRATPDGIKVPLPTMSEVVSPLQPARNEPSTDITVGDWFDASGTLTIQCKDDGTSQVRGSFKGLVENGLYGVYATWITVLPGTVDPTFMPFAFGGVPSLVTANEKGAANFYREMSFCPLDESPDGSKIMFVNVGYHVDAGPTGVFPQLADEVNGFISVDGDYFESTTPPGTITVPHLQFPINATEL